MRHGLVRTAALACAAWLAQPSACLDSRGRARDPPLLAAPERGYHGHETCESPILVQPRAEAGQQRAGRFLLCVPYKNGWGWWSTTACDAEGRGAACHAGYRSRTQALDYLWWRHSDAEVAAVYGDASLPKVKLVRNPLTRVLAAWLTWVGRARPGDYNYVEEDFGDFVRRSLATRANCHWSRQPRHCGEDEGVPWELLKVEERHLWGPRLLQRLGLLGPAAANGGIRTEARGECPGHECSATPFVARHYTPELVELVRAHYAEEIARYNYTADVERWAERIAWAALEDGPPQPGA